MNRSIASPMTAVALSLTLAAACLSCRSTSEGLKEDASRNSRSLEAGVTEMKKDAAEGAEVASEALAGAADEAGTQASVMKSTFDVKTALMADARVDASRINVDSDGETKVVALRGQVTTLPEVELATEIAKGKAGDWRVVNELVVAPKD